MFVRVELLYGTQGKEGKEEFDRPSVIVYNLRCEGRGCKDVC
jgi:hypothetical protein